MSITFNGTTQGQRIEFDSSPSVYGLTKITIISKFMPTLAAVPSIDNRILEIVHPTAVNTNERLLFAINGAVSDVKRFFYTRTCTGGSGFAQWQSNTDLMLLNVVRQVAITHDLTSLANDPLFYLDGVSTTVTEQQTPTTAYRTTGATNCIIGGKAGTSSVEPLGGHLYQLLIYNRILSPAEISYSYNSKLAIPIRNGLVFAPNLLGAQGVQDGDTLTSSNKIKDIVSGSLGTPNGNPIIRATTKLNYGGE